MKKMIGSGPTLEGLSKKISEYFYSATFLVETRPDHWLVFNAEGIIQGFKVIKKKDRFRFERTDEKLNWNNEGELR